MATSILTSIEGRRLGIAPSGELVLGPGQPFGVTAVAVADGSNVTKITLQVVDRDDVAVAGVFNLDVLLSDAADGSGITATASSGAVADKTTGTLGSQLLVKIAKKAFQAQTNSSGVYAFNITDTAKTLFKIGVVFRNKTTVPVTLLTASYGA